MAWPSPGPPNGPCTDALLCYARPAACVTGTLFSYLNFIYRYLSGAVHKLRHTIGGGGGGLLNVTSLCQMHGKVTLALAA